MKTPTREKRNSALSHYHGTLASILEDGSGKELPQRVRTFSQSSPGEILYALEAVSGIRNSAVVIHGSAGCAASGLFFSPGNEQSWYSTNLNESDTILGGDEKLRTAIRRAYNETRPEIIFIIGTPINAINNDDVDSAVMEAGDELDCKIVYIEVNGFKTKNALTGYDVVSHGFLKYLVEQRKPQERPFINLCSLSENTGNVAVIAGLLERLEIPCNILPWFSSLSNIKMAGSALCGVSLNDAENEYLMSGLEEQFGVSWIKTNPPIGTMAVYNFIKKIAARFDRTSQAEVLIKDEEQKANIWLSKKPFAGKKVFLTMDLQKAVSFSALVEELGGEVSGIAIPHLDTQNQGKLRDLASLSRTIPVIIAQGQQFEIANALVKYPADFYIGKSETAVTAARFGARPLSLDELAYYGYAGIGQVARRAFKLGVNNGYAELLGQNAGASYSDMWLKKSGNWHIKLEVL